MRIGFNAVALACCALVARGQNVWHVDASAPTERHGLANLKQRLEEIGGTCLVKSAPGKGTNITLLWPSPGRRPAGAER